jgi:hypothetical protein
MNRESQIGTDKKFDPGSGRIFVFGSNRAGNHAGGAAAYAQRELGACAGQGEGLQGQSYALPTLNENFRPLVMHELRAHVDAFLDFARAHRSIEFFVTRVG